MHSPEIEVPACIHSIHNECNVHVSVENMSEAAMLNQSDFGEGVSTSVMCGQTAHVGTGMCTVRIGGEKPLPSVGAAPSALRRSRV